MAALRLYHIIPESETVVPENSEELVDSWRRVLIGQQERVSETNETSWRETLLRICQRVEERARSGMKNLMVGEAALETDNRPEWLNWMLENIRLLWREELEVSEAVASSVRSGEEF